MSTFGKRQRLLKAIDFKTVFSDPPFRASNKYLLMLAKPHRDAIKNDGRKANARLGLVVAKKNVRLAVDRNRVKRLVRESFRRRQHLLEGIDIIVLARRGVDRQSNRQLFKAIDEQWLIIRKKANRANATRATLA